MKTNLDLLTSAEATARLMMQAPNVLAAQQTKLANFEATGQDVADYTVWSGMVHERLVAYNRAQKQDAPSAVAAKQAAQVAAAAKPAAQAPAAPAAS